jgi:small subunit ribosomal protein S2
MVILKGFMMTNVKTDVKEMLASGVHFGHRTSRRHPKMSQYIHSKKGEAHIIDLIKTEECLKVALDEVTKVVASGKTVLFVGTKRQAKKVAKQAATDTKMPYVTERWLGGMLTNSKTMSGRIKHLLDLESKMESGELNDRFNKLEVQRFQEEIDKLNNFFSGLKNHPLKPGLVFISDITVDANAVREAKTLKIPVVGICDTNADPTLIDFPIPANDDALKSIQLITSYVAQAIEEGRASAPKQKDADKEEVKEVNKEAKTEEKK